MKRKNKTVEEGKKSLTQEIVMKIEAYAAIYGDKAAYTLLKRLTDYYDWRSFRLER